MINGAVAFLITVVTGVGSGSLAHLLFDPLLEELDLPSGVELPARYGIGWISGLPTYLLIRYAQQDQHKKAAPIHRVAFDYVGLGVLLGFGVMLPRFIRWWWG